MRRPSRLRGAGPGEHKPLPFGDGGPDRQVRSRQERAAPGRRQTRHAPPGLLRRRGDGEPHREARDDPPSLERGRQDAGSGSLSWIWAKSAATISIPGFRTVAQVEENAGAMRFGAMSAEAMNAIDDALGRQTETSPKQAQPTQSGTACVQRSPCLRGANSRSLVSSPRTTSARRHEPTGPRRA